MSVARKAGFYWVRHNKEMTIAQWCTESGEWFLIGIEKESNHITDEDLEDIGLWEIGLLQLGCSERDRDHVAYPGARAAIAGPVI